MDHCTLNKINQKRGILIFLFNLFIILITTFTEKLCKSQNISQFLFYNDKTPIDYCTIL